MFTDKISPNGVLRVGLRAVPVGLCFHAPILKDLISLFLFYPVCFENELLDLQMEAHFWDVSSVWCSETDSPFCLHVSHLCSRALSKGRQKFPLLTVDFGGGHSLGGGVKWLALEAGVVGALWQPCVRCTEHGWHYCELPFSAWRASSCSGALSGFLNVTHQDASYPLCWKSLL